MILNPRRDERLRSYRYQPYKPQAMPLNVNKPNFSLVSKSDFYEVPKYKPRQTFHPPVTLWNSRFRTAPSQWYRNNDISFQPTPQEFMPQQEIKKEQFPRPPIKLESEDSMQFDDDDEKQELIPSASNTVVPTNVEVSTALVQLSNTDTFDQQIDQKLDKLMSLVDNQNTQNEMEIRNKNYEVSQSNSLQPFEGTGSLARLASAGGWIFKKAVQATSLAADQAGNLNVAAKVVDSDITKYGIKGASFFFPKIAWVFEKGAQVTSGAAAAANMAAVADSVLAAGNSNIGRAAIVGAIGTTAWGRKLINDRKTLNPDQEIDLVQNFSAAQWKTVNAAMTDEQRLEVLNIMGRTVAENMTEDYVAEDRDQFIQNANQNIQILKKRKAKLEDFEKDELELAERAVTMNKIMETLSEAGKHLPPQAPLQIENGQNYSEAEVPSIVTQETGSGSGSGISGWLTSALGFGKSKSPTESSGSELSSVQGTDTENEEGSPTKSASPLTIDTTVETLPKTPTPTEQTPSPKATTPWTEFDSDTLDFILNGDAEDALLSPNYIQSVNSWANLYAGTEMDDIKAEFKSIGVQKVKKYLRELGEFKSLPKPLTKDGAVMMIYALRKK